MAVCSGGKGNVNSTRLLACWIKNSCMDSARLAKKYLEKTQLSTEKSPRAQKHGIFVE
jgi:hypothetical protein